MCKKILWEIFQSHSDQIKGLITHQLCTEKIFSSAIIFHFNSYEEQISEGNPGHDPNLHN